MRVSGYSLAASLLLLATGGIVFLRGFAPGETGAAGQGSGAPPPAIRKAGDRGENWRRRSINRSGRSAVAAIRAAMSADLSDPDTLQEALAACHRLNAVADIKDLLSDPAHGWPPLAAGRDHYFYGSAQLDLYRALLERWGRLDFEDALSCIRNAGEVTVQDPVGFLVGTGSLFKGAASLDGRHALQRLKELSGEPEGWITGIALREAVMGPLMEGWASSDEIAAWDALYALDSDDSALGYAVAGFFHGLPPGRIGGMREKVEAYAKGGEPGGLNPAAHIRREFAENWLLTDPGAALAWYEPHAGDLLVNRNSIDAILDETGKTRVFARLLGEWMADDLERASAWLPSWQPQAVSADAVFQGIAGDESLPETVRERAGELIRER